MWNRLSSNHNKDAEGLKIKKTALNNAREQLAEKKAAVEEEINREVDAQSINSKDRTDRFIKYINIIHLEGFVQEQERSKSNKFHTRNNQIKKDP